MGTPLMGQPQFILGLVTGRGRRILIELTIFLLSLIGEDVSCLRYETQRPFAFTGGLVYSGLANNSRNVFVSGSDLVPNKNKVPILI
jgi:hypothetical protein